MTEYQETVSAELHLNPESNHSTESPKRVICLQFSPLLVRRFFFLATAKSRTWPSACWIIKSERWQGTKQSLVHTRVWKLSWTICPCSFSFTVVVALPCSHCVTSNKLASSKQVKHKRSTLRDTSSEVFKFKKLSPKVCVSVLPSCLPVVQRSLRRPVSPLPFHLPSLGELFPCFPLGYACTGNVLPGGSTSGGCQNSNPQSP